jgi:hypothetical protein
VTPCSVVVKYRPCCLYHQDKVTSPWRGGVTTQSTSIWIFTIVKTLNFAQENTNIQVLNEIWSSDPSVRTDQYHRRLASAITGMRHSTSSFYSIIGFPWIYSSKMVRLSVDFTKLHWEFTLFTLHTLAIIYKQLCLAWYKWKCKLKILPYDKFRCK